MSLPVLNWSDLEWRDWTEGPRVYHTRYALLAEPLGAQKLGYHAETLPPRTALSPFHAHLVNEELFVVLAGDVAIRLEQGEHPLRAGDLAGIPPGPRGAHQLLNRSDRPAHLLALATAIPRDVVDYPDSGKRLYAVGELAAGEDVPPPGAPEARRASVMVREGRAVDYYAGEPEHDLSGPAPPDALAPDRRVVRADDLPWEPYRIGPFAAERKRLAPRAGLGLLGCSLYRLAPGERSWAFHFHHLNEEFFYVLSGRGRLRTREGVRKLRAGDAFACPPGPDGAHAIEGVGDAPLQYLAVSTMEHPEVLEYPDSGKVGVMVGRAPGGGNGAGLVALFRRLDAVPYAEGEA